MTNNIQWVLDALKEQELRQAQETADGDKKDNHNGDSNMEREQ